MIIKSLYDYYMENRDVKNEDKEKIFPEYGYALERVCFKLSVTKEGKFESLDILSRTVSLPCDAVLDIARTSNQVASHFFGNEKYIFGSSLKKGSKFLDAPKHLAAFINLHKEIFKATNNKILGTILTFLKSVQNGSFDLTPIKEIYKKVEERGIILLCVGDDFLHEQKDLLKYWEGKVKNYVGPWGQCLITGEKQRLQKIHGKIKGVGTATGSTLVSFNRAAHKSYTKKNIPLAYVGAKTAFAYCTVLNFFLSKFSEMNHSKLGEDFLVFWTNKRRDNFFCRLLKRFIGTGEKEDDTPSQLKSAVESLVKGEKPSIVPDDSKFSLGMLSPNKGRIYVREFIEQPLEKMLSNVSQHCADMAFLNYDIPSLYALSWISLSGKSRDKKPSSTVCKSLLQSIVKGEPYSSSLALTVLGHSLKPYSKEGFNRRHLQCMFLKAYLNRKYRTDQRKEISMALDKERKNIGYLLGRLLAISDSILRASIPRPNKTYEDRFRSCLGRTPLFVLRDLTDRVSNHLSKLRKTKTGLWVILDKEYSAVFSMIQAGNIPTVLDFDEQAEFVIGFQQEHENQFSKNQNQSTSQKEDGDEEQENE